MRISGWDHPNTARTVRGWMPANSNKVAAVCRASCRRASLTPASARSCFQAVQSFLGLIGLPVGVAKTQPVPEFNHLLPAAGASVSAQLARPPAPADDPGDRQEDRWCCDGPKRGLGLGRIEITDMDPVGTSGRRLEGPLHQRQPRLAPLSQRLSRAVCDSEQFELSRRLPLARGLGVTPNGMAGGVAPDTQRRVPVPSTL
jgi:hypothetical protein